MHPRRIQLSTRVPCIQAALLARECCGRTDKMWTQQFVEPQEIVVVPLAQGVAERAAVYDDYGAAGGGHGWRSPWSSSIPISGSMIAQSAALGAIPTRPPSGGHVGLGASTRLSAAAIQPPCANSPWTSLVYTAYC